MLIKSFICEKYQENFDKNYTLEIFNTMWVHKSKIRTLRNWKWSLLTNFKDLKNQNTTHNLLNNGKAFLCRGCLCVAEIQLHCLIFKFRDFDQLLNTIQGYHKALFLTKELVSLFTMPLFPSNLVLNIAALRPSKWASIITVCAYSHVQTLTWKSFPGIETASQMPKTVKSLVQVDESIRSRQFVFHRCLTAPHLCVSEIIRAFIFMGCGILSFTVDHAHLEK